MTCSARQSIAVGLLAQLSHVGTEIYAVKRPGKHRLANQDDFKPDMYVSTVDNPAETRKPGRKSPNKPNHGMEMDYFPGAKQEQDTANEDDFLNAASWELVEKPTYHGTIKAISSLPTLTLIAAYFCTFGTELAVNSFLGAYYLKNFPHLGQTGSGRWAAMYGLLNAVFRPMGGMISDLIYWATKSLWAKKILMHSLAIIMGCFMLAIGFLDPHHKSTMFGLMTGLAFFVEAGNGSVFSLLPHVHPTSNGESFRSNIGKGSMRQPVADNYPKVSSLVSQVPLGTSEGSSIFWLLDTTARIMQKFSGLSVSSILAQA